MIPEQIASELGLRQRGTRRVVYADERRDDRPLAGPVTVRIGELTTRTDCIVGVAGSQVLIAPYNFNTQARNTQLGIVPCGVELGEWQLPLVPHESSMLRHVSNQAVGRGQCVQGADQVT